MKRRDFITCFGLGYLASSLPEKVVASPPETTAMSTSGDWQTVGTIAELDKAGQLLNENSPVGSVLVIGTSKSKKLVAVNPSCTHMGCTVEWLAEEKIFLCCIPHSADVTQIIDIFEKNQLGKFSLVNFSV